MRPLHERHLVSRDITTHGTLLRTHRVLQRSILHGLDNDVSLRQKVFDEVVQIVRKAFPTQSVKNRGDPKNWPASRIYITHVIHLNTAFCQSDTSIRGGLSFAELLSDAGNYLFNDGVQMNGVPLLETCEAVCSANMEEEPASAIPILTDALGILQIFNQFMSNGGRTRAMNFTTRVLKLRLNELKDVPTERWSEMDVIKVARSYVDCGCTKSQLNLLAEARDDFDQGLHYYSRLWTEETLAARFGHLYSCKLYSSATIGTKEETVDLAGKAMSLTNSCYGPDHHLAIQTKFRAAIALFAVGEIEQALKLHKEVFEARRRIIGPDHQETLASQYNLAVVLHNTKDLETAE